jgi:hypothetical protein
MTQAISLFIVVDVGDTGWRLKKLRISASVVDLDTVDS